MHPPFINGGHLGSPSSSSPGSSSVPSFWRPHGGSSFSSSPSPCHHGGLCTVVGPFPRAMGGIPVWLHRLPRAWHLQARCFTLLCRRRITIPLLDLTLPCHFPALVKAYLLLSCTTPRTRMTISVGTATNMGWSMGLPPRDVPSSSFEFRSQASLGIPLVSLFF